MLLHVPKAEAEITLSKGYVSKAKPKKGILLHLHGCGGLSTKDLMGEWFKHFERSGYRVVAPDSFAEDRPPKSCAEPYPFKQQIHALRVDQTNRAVEKLSADFPGTPIYVWGHSEGSSLAMRLKQGFAGVVLTGGACGYGREKSIDLPANVPLVILMGDPKIDHFLRDQLRGTGETSMRSLCQRVVYSDRWRWTIFTDMGHIIPIWDKRVLDAVNDVIPISQKYVGVAPPRKVPLGSGYRVRKETKKAFRTRYLGWKKNKAFAIGPSGSWGAAAGWGNTVDARLQALYRCQVYTKRGRCAIYAVNDHIVLGRRSSYEVERVQMYLTALGYDPGPIDGIWGGKTLKALNAVRADKELPAIKSLDEKTLELLEEWHFFHSGTRELPNK